MVDRKRWPWAGGLKPIYTMILLGVGSARMWRGTTCCWHSSRLSLPHTLFGSPLYCSQRPWHADSSHQESLGRLRMSNQSVVGDTAYPSFHSSYPVSWVCGPARPSVKPSVANRPCRKKKKKKKIRKESKKPKNNSCLFTYMLLLCSVHRRECQRRPW